MFFLILSLSYMVFGVAMLLPVLRTFVQKQDRMGRAPVQWVFFLGGKAAMGISLAMPVSLLFRDLSWTLGVHLIKWAALGLFAAGAVLFFLAMSHLGDDALKMGLPKSGDDTSLKTRGLYRISRNPIYLSLFQMMFASQFLCPGVVNFISALAAVVVHHRIVLSEERFLAQRFKGAWTEYKKNVRRYF